MTDPIEREAAIKAVRGSREDCMCHEKTVHALRALPASPVAAAAVALAEALSSVLDDPQAAADALTAAMEEIERLVREARKEKR